MNKRIQRNIRCARVNYCELLLLITKYCPAIKCLQETHLKNNTINMKTIIPTTILNSTLIDL